MNRREFLIRAAAIAASGSLYRCSTLGSSQSSDASWLESVDPIQRTLTSSDFYLGDNPSHAHPHLRDIMPAPLGMKPTKTEKLIVIGGGMGGLSSAYLHRHLKPVVIERASCFGGNAKGESWEGIDYTMGAAYLTEGEEDSPLLREFHRPLGIDKTWKITHNDYVELRGKKTKLTQKHFKIFEEFLHYSYDKKFPEIPRKPGSQVSDREFREWDNMSFYSFIKNKILKAKPDPVLYSLFENYCFAAFGGSSREVSGAAGLNFMASEIKGVRIIPGGNSFVASAFLKSLASELPRENLKTSSTVTSVRAEKDQIIVEYLDPAGEKKVLGAERVIMACPKFVAARIVHPLPTKQLEAISKIKYRSYLVGNILIDGHFEADFYDIYLLGDGKVSGNAEADDKNQGATDAIASHWWYGNNNSLKGVLTLFRALPYDGARGKILAEDSLAEYKTAFRAQGEKILKVLNGKNVKIQDVRVTRWGHPLPLCEIGALSKGIHSRASQSIDNRIFFCNQDNWLLPATETALHEALAIRDRLKA